MSSGDGIEHACEAGCLRIRLFTGDILSQPDPTVRRLTAIVEASHPLVTLIDFRRVPIPPTFGALYTLGEVVGRYLPGRPIAALIRPDQADRGNIGKLVANNRGAHVEVFTDEPSAEQWMRSQSALHRQSPSPS